MFKVTFRDVSTEQNLSEPVFLPDVPGQGEAVYFRDRAGSTRRAEAGRVVSRHWHIATKEPGESEIVILMAMDK